jgi:hypothetical protein
MKSDPRTDPEAAYQAFMSMHVSEWAGLIRSLMMGGVLTPAEQEGFDRALAERGLT